MAKTTFTALFLFFLLFLASLANACSFCKLPKPCPRDTLKLAECANVLGLVSWAVGKPPGDKCCALLEGLVDLEVAACLCTAIKANVVGIKLDVPVALSLVVNSCGKKVPDGFKCA